MQSTDHTPQPVADVNVTVTVTEAEALALAQMMKRIGWEDWRRNAADDNEASLMRDACERLRVDLANAGFAPR